jgi:DNA-binding LacI/PurR family transcriptional regulator
MTAGRTPTIRDVARAAGVSLTTVSDAINGRGRIHPETRRRVMEAVEEVGWQPKRSARALRSGRSGMIALCLPSGQSRPGSWLNTDYYMEIMAGCAAEAMNTTGQLLLAHRPRDAREAGRLDVDGVIVTDPIEDDPTLRILDEAGIPFVTVDRDLARDDPWWVGADNRGSVTALLDHLADRGSRTVALFTSRARWAYLEDISEAYAGWCSARNMEPLVREIDLYEPATDAAAAFTEMIDADIRPDGVVAVLQGSALGVIGAAGARGVSVPDDLLVVSGVDGHALETSVPPVTAVNLRPAEVGAAAVDLLRRRIEGEEGIGPVVTDIELRIRGSS